MTVFSSLVKEGFFFNFQCLYDLFLKIFPYNKIKGKPSLLSNPESTNCKFAKTFRKGGGDGGIQYY